MVLSASLSKARTHNSRWSSRVSSILLWLMPWRLCTNIITVGTPARATSAASCNGPEGMRWLLPQVSEIALSQKLISSGLKRTGSMFHRRSQETRTLPSAAKRSAAARASANIAAKAVASKMPLIQGDAAFLDDAGDDSGFRCA